jgi:hypothetical protein
VPKKKVYILAKTQKFKITVYYIGLSRECVAYFMVEEKVYICQKFKITVSLMGNVLCPRVKVKLYFTAVMGYLMN